MTRVAYVIGTYPRLTTTFIDREVRLLRARGVEVEVFSIRRPDALLSPDQAEAGRAVRYLLPTGPGAVLRAHLRYARRAAYWRTAAHLVTQPHPTLRARLKTVVHFAAGVCAADRMADGGFDRIHAHFVDRAAVVALTAGALLGRPYSATAHAADIYVAPVLLEAKLRRADFVATCTTYNQAHLRRSVPGVPPDRVVRIYHGLEVDRYRPDGRPRTAEPTILAVGQLKEKKGFPDLLAAWRILADQGYRFQGVIVGDGPLGPQLEARVRELALDDVVTLTGALPHDEVIAWYRRAAVFVLPCVTGADGDRDGLPNVILEAMAMGLPVVSTDTSAVGEAVEDDRTGRLVPPGDPEALAAALADLLRRPEEGARLGRNGRRVALDHFDVAANVSALHRQFASLA